MPRIRFATFELQAPPKWSDSTAEVEVENPPFTVSRTDGVGALQFSIALYQSGVAPTPCPDELAVMVRQFAASRGWGEGENWRIEKGPPCLAAASYFVSDDFVRVWQLSDGRNYAFATYMCEARQVGPELPACERIVRSLHFCNAG